MTEKTLISLHAYRELMATYAKIKDVIIEINVARILRPY